MGSVLDILGLSGGQGTLEERSRVRYVKLEFKKVRDRFVCWDVICIRMTVNIKPAKNHYLHCNPSLPLRDTAQQCRVGGI